MKLSATLLNVALASALAVPEPATPHSSRSSLSRTKARIAARRVKSQIHKTTAYGGSSSSSSSSGSSSSSSFGSSSSSSPDSSFGGFGSGFGGGFGGSSGSSDSDSGFGGASPSGSPSFGGASPSGSSSFGDSPNPTASAVATATSTSSSDSSSDSSDDSSDDSSSVASESTKSSSTEMNESWAGAVVTGSGMTGVSASFKVPTPKIPTSGQTSATEHIASAWIGMDGYNCDGGLWQAGVDAQIDSSGSTSYYAWYEWYPSDTVEVDLGTLTAGDTITVNLTSSGAYTSGNIVMENTSSGKSFTKTVTDSDALCGSAIEWIMEDLVVDGSYIGLADFGSVTFSDAVGTSSSGSVSASSASLMDIEDSDGTALTSSSVSGNTVVIKYE